MSQLHRILLHSFPALVLGMLVCAAVSAQELNGFKLRSPLVPAEQIFSGGPPRDGIPALENPAVVNATQATYLHGEDRVLGFVHNGQARAYPIRIMDWHEIVNDRIGDLAVVISYCPLCGSGMAFAAKIQGQRRVFGVSGLLYNSDVLLYDRGTESLWSQIMGQAINGPLAGTLLTQLPLSHTSWADWKSRYPATQVLSSDTGYRRNYQRSPYLGYDQTPQIYFPVSHQDKRFHPKELVLGLAIGNKYKAYPFSELARSGTPVTELLNGQSVTVEYDAANRSAQALVNGREIPATTLFWFAWLTFHADTEVYRASEKP